MSGPEQHHTVASLGEVVFPDRSATAVDLVVADVPAAEAEVFAALVFLQDREGRFALVYSPRRAEWASPGGGREPGEDVRATVVREVLEETGLAIGADDLHPCGYERFRPLTAGRWPAAGGCLQAFRARLDASRPPMAAGADDVTGHRWVTFAEFEALCGSAFWWPLAEALFSPTGGTARERG